MKARIGGHGRRERAWLLAAAALVSGCAGRPPVSTAPAEAAACIVSDGAAPARLRVAVAGPVDVRNAPVPRTDAERLVFRQLYETLVRVDCRGDVAAGLAEAWSTADGGRTWTLRLRNGTTFTNGDTVTSEDVLNAWRLRGVDTTFAEMAALNARELRVVLHDTASAPRILADPRYVITQAAAPGAWPGGTGVYRVAAAGDRRIRLESRDPALPAMDVELTAADARAALDDGFDAVVSSDVATIEYAGALPGYTAAQLPWNRTYMLVGANDSRADADAAARSELARDAVRGAVRPAEPSSGPRSARCSGALPARGSTHAIAYPAGDPIARGLAERIAALAWPASRTPAWLRAQVRPAERAPVVLPMRADALERALHADTSLAFVIATPRTAACGIAGTALVDARDHLLHRGNLGRVIADGDGSLRFGAAR